MTLKIVYGNGMFTIDSEDFAYCRIMGMYTIGDGCGLQVNNEADRPSIKRMCDQIYKDVVRRHSEFNRAGDDQEKERDVDMCVQHGGEPVQVPE